MAENLSVTSGQVQGKNFLHNVSSKLKSVTEYLTDVVDLFDKPDATQKAQAVFEAATPWVEHAGMLADYAGEVLPPIKLLSKLATEITKINDPEKLGYIACTLAFQRAVELAVKDIAAPTDEKTTGKEVKAQLKEISLEESGFDTFSLDTATTHNFYIEAEHQADTALLFLGYGNKQREEVLIKVKDEFKECLTIILTDGETAEKFKPFKDYILLGREDRIARKNLARHADYQIWQYTSAPVLGREPFALKDVFVEPECGVLRWSNIHPDEEKRNRRNKEQVEIERKNPFNEEHGGREKMLNVVMRLIANEKEKEPIIIQGYAGSGKTSFTLRLCEELVKKGLSPVRVRLRDISLSQNIETALNQAARLSNEEYVDTNPFLNNEILREKGVGEFSKICRYVLILDGWDEISVSANEGFKSKVTEMLKQLTSVYLEYKKALNIKIVFTGRPSTDVTGNTFLKGTTPILTVRDSNPAQFEQFVNKITEAVKPDNISAFRDKLKDSPKQYVSDEIEADEMPLDIEDWQQLTKDKFSGIIETYRKTPKEIEVLGLPLLAHLASRLVAVWKGDADALIRDKTRLYRNLINMTCEKAGKASLDARDTKDEICEQARFTGLDLRKLLWGTASAMSLFGEDSISYEELERRLESDEELKAIVEEIAGANWLSSLLISFYFKGGSKDLGCEFSHKSFREYLFAEAILETLKEYGRIADDSYPERKNYWEDFNPKDKRYDFFRKFSKLFAANGLSEEVYFYLENLLQWEISRIESNKQSQEVGLETELLSLEEWEKVRNGLTYIWGWWVDKVHLRLRPEENRRGDIDFSIRPFVYELIDHVLSKTKTQTPMIAGDVDYFLGLSTFILTSLVYNITREEIIVNKKELIQHQSLLKNKVIFSPSDNEGFVDLENRIRIISLYGGVLRRINIAHLDLSRGILFSLSFRDANLQGSNFSNNFLSRLNIWNSDLSFGMFDGLGLEYSAFNLSNLFRSSFKNCRLNNSNFISSTAVRADFSNSTLMFCNLFRVDLTNTIFQGTTFRLCSLDNSNCESAIFDKTSFQDCTFHSTNFNNVDLSKTKGITKDQLEKAYINEKTILPKDLEQYKEHFINLNKERMKTPDNSDVIEIDIPDVNKE